MIEARDLHYRYPDGGFQLQLPLWQVQRGSRVLVVGPSGSGKTTLLGLLAGVLPVSSGKLRVGSEQLDQCTDAQRRTMRISSVGQVFQDLELVKYLTVRENILLPYFINRRFQLTPEAERRAGELAEQSQISDQLDRPVDRLSRGEQQRVAVCRALVVQPALVLADEPTASLDGATGGQLLEMLFESCRQTGAPLVMVSHQESLASECDQLLDLSALPIGEE